MSSRPTTVTNTPSEVNLCTRRLSSRTKTSPYASTSMPVAGQEDLPSPPTCWSVHPSHRGRLPTGSTVGPTRRRSRRGTRSRPVRRRWPPGLGLRGRFRASRMRRRNCRLVRTSRLAAGRCSTHRCSPQHRWPGNWGSNIPRTRRCPERGTDEGAHHWERTRKPSPGSAATHIAVTPHVHVPASVDIDCMAPVSDVARDGPRTDRLPARGVTMNQPIGTGGIDGPVRGLGNRGWIGGR